MAIAPDREWPVEAHPDVDEHGERCEDDGGESCRRQFAADLGPTTSVRSILAEGSIVWIVSRTFETASVCACSPPG